MFEKFYHDTLNEKEGHLPIGKAREFILQQFDKPFRRQNLLDADRRGQTKNEYNALTRPLSPFSLKAIYYGVTRFSLRTTGRLSDGIRVGLETGFDSGSSLDYVYRNRPAGTTPIGKLMDWGYLNGTGWRGIRQRKLHLERLILETAQAVQRCGRSPKFLDIAAGHGRYLLEVLLQLQNKTPFEALLRDYSGLNVEQGRKLINEMGLSKQARFEAGDAFDRASLANIEPHPNIVIVSGLYELFADNAPVQSSLAGIAEGMEENGYLIYTNQPWHPQLELIARVLTSHRDGAPWIMRRRTQMEIDQLVEAAGFTKTEQLIDRWGIFSVSVARRVKS